MSTEHTSEQFQQDLRALGIRSGDVVLMHSSFKSLGAIEGGPHGLFSAFFDLLTPNGTLMLPALSYATVDRMQPVFDQRNTPSCIGFLPEYFRTQVSGVIRSLHATHSCCIRGRYAAFLAENHELDETPVGANSPLRKLPVLDGWILMLGCSPDHNTSMHGVEETAEPPYLLDRSSHIPYVLRRADGNEIVRPSLRHNFVINNRRFSQRYSRILPLLSYDEVHYGKVLDADCVLMRAAAVWTKGHDMLKKNPWYFVE